MKRSLFLLIMIVLPWCGLVFAEISVQIEPPKVALGETFRLTFTTDSPKDTGVPDVTPLQKDFKIVGTERSLSYSMMDHQSHAVSQWTIVLVAKKAGVFSIPPIQIGQQVSPVTQVTITDDQTTTNTSDPATTSQEEVLLKVSVSQPHPYVNQQVIYTVKLYNSEHLLDAEYLPPRVEDALLIPLGSGTRYQAMLHGRPYTVEEQRYAVSPQKSGDLTIHPPAFRALVYDFVPRRVRIRAKPMHLHVKPIPTNYQGKDWLPSKHVALKETYDIKRTNLPQGNTLTRTITLEANGIPAQLLPKLSFPTSAQFSSYPEPPSLHNVLRNQELLGQETIKITYLLNTAGEITLPSVRLRWFNTADKKEEWTTLPERVIQVTSEQKPKAPISANSDTNHEGKATSKPSADRTNKPLASLGWWVASALGAAWVITLLLWWFRKQKPKQNQRRTALKRLKHACQSHDPKQVQIALLEWAKLQWPEATCLNVHHVAQLIPDPKVKQQIQHLSEVLYRHKPGEAWDTEAFWRDLVAYLHAKPKAKQHKKDSLPPMNPR